MVSRPSVSRPLVAALAALLLPSCATIVSDTSTLLHIDSNASEARVRVLDAEERPVFEGVTPCHVEVENGAGYWKGARYVVEVEKDGYLPGRVELESELNPAFFGNALLPGGLIGSLLIDPLSGAMFELAQDRLLVELDSVAP